MTRIIINVKSVNNAATIDVRPSWDGSLSPEEKLAHDLLLRFIDGAIDLMLQNSKKGRLYVGEHIDKEVAAAIDRLKSGGM